jgi:phosphohistidine phosphatase
MELYLVRHAIAEERAPGGRDAERALTPAGKQKMARATEGLRKLEIKPDLILTSPLRRADDTARIVAAGLGGMKIKVLPELAPGTDPASVVAALRIYRRLKALALVGHQPGLGYLASLILTGSRDSLDLDLKKGGVACIETGLSSGLRAGVLRWLVTPKLLRGL